MENRASEIDLAWVGLTAKSGLRILIGGHLHGPKKNSISGQTGKYIAHLAGVDLLGE